MKDKTETKKSSIRPAFTIYHPNSKGNGSAVAFRTYPATVKASGFLQIEISRQQTVGDSERRVFPTFDWKGRIIARLTPLEVGEVVGVLKGTDVSVRDGEGFRHRTDGGATRIALAQVVEPKPSYHLKLSHETLANEDREISIWITPEEAYTLGMGLAASMGRLCFGP
ncbi:MAG: hypothetical protein J6Q22_09390 [Prevotella sp.]|nr:hypothetical protein [Prevotella sp.]